MNHDRPHRRAPRLTTTRVAVAFVGAAVAAAAVALSAAAGGAPNPALAHNRLAAKFDGAAMLAAVELPAGAVQLAKPPPGSGGKLHALSGAGISAAVEQARWWQVPGNPAAVFAYIRAHPPGGRPLTGHGYTGGMGQPITDRYAIYEWPPIVGELGSRMLQVGTSASGTGTLVWAHSESEWIIPRPADEVVPAAAREVDVTSVKVPSTGSTSAGVTTVSLHVTSRPKVLALIRLVDGLETTQPVAFNCADYTPPHDVTLTFRRREGSLALARAEFSASGRRDVAYECDPIGFWVRGRRRHYLRGALIGPASQILGVNLARG